MTAVDALRGRRVLVTGGAGFIGAHVVCRLLELDAAVTVLDDFSRGTMAALAPAFARGLRHDDVVTVDICAPPGPAAIEDRRPDVVVHLAAQSRVARSIDDPVADARTNVLGTVSLLSAAHRAGVRGVVYASSGGTVYGEGTVTHGALREEHPRAAVSPYGLSKSTGDLYLRMYEDLYGLPFTSLAFGNVYGPGCDGGLGAGVIAHFVGDILAGRAPTVHGDGRQTRDYVHVADVVEAIVLACACPGAREINIGSGTETSVLDVLDLVCAELSTRPNPRFVPPAPGEVRRVCLDNGRARRVLGWQPRTPLDAGIRELVTGQRVIAVR
jgi:UDP-glucose 4-epimerase